MLKNLLHISPRMRTAFMQLLIPVFSMPYGCSQHTQSTSTIGNLSFQVIPFDSPDLVRPGAGAESWNGQNVVNIPIEGIDSQRLDRYYRFLWSDLETGDGQYDWTRLDEQLNDAIRHRQKFGFGVMPHCESCKTGLNVDGAQLAYPKFLHEQMMKETVRPYVFKGNWTPNWNSDFYLSALERLNKAINDHLQQGSFDGVKYKDIINYIDLRGFGSYGEWHHYPYRDREPAANKVNTTSLHRIIDSYKNGFPEFRLVAMIAGFDPGGWSNMPPDISYYLLTAKNKAGEFGWRRDSYGDAAEWFPKLLENNPVKFERRGISELIMNKWKYAPIVGEPMQCCTQKGGDCAYWELESQVRRYHVSSFGNGNLESTMDCARNSIRNASRAAGYRLILAGGDIDSIAKAGSNISITLLWKNIGIAPTYENWNVEYQLRELRSDSLRWQASSSFTPTNLLPLDTASISKDRFEIPKNIPPGNYNLLLVIKDPKGYRQPLPLAIEGRNSDGSYALRSITIK